MSNIDRKRIAAELQRIYKDAANEYDRAVTRDHEQQAREGATNIRAGFAFSENRDAAVEDIMKAGKKALAVVDGGIAAAQDSLTGPPSDEGARYIVGLQGRSDLTQDEYDAALSRYHGHAEQKAIIAAAKRSGFNSIYGGGNTDAETDMADLRKLRADVQKEFSPFSFESANPGYRAIVTGGFAAFVKPDADAFDAFAFSGAQDGE